MTISYDRTAYEDCYDLFDKALVSDRGVRMKFSKYGQAVNFRLRMNRARQLDRETNRRIHADDPNHPEFARSKYSVFTIRIHFDDDKHHWWMLVQRNQLNDNLIEEIPPDDEWQDFKEEVEAETGLDLSEVEEITDEREGAS